MTRLQEIAFRIAAIRTEMETRGQMTAEEMTAFENEVNALQEERANIEGIETRRQAMLAGMTSGAEGIVTRSFPSPSGNPNANSEPESRTASLEYRRAFMDHVLRGTEIPVELRANATTMVADVGAVIPETILNKIVEKMENVGGILALITKTNIKGGVSVPTSSVKPVATWVGEGKVSETQKKSATKDGAITFAYHKLRCAVAVSMEVATTTLAVFESTMIANIFEAMAKAKELAIINGSGTGQPKGILKEIAPTKQVINSILPSYADLVAAEGSLPSAYENNARYCMSKMTFMLYYGLTDDGGKPLATIIYGQGSKPQRYLLGRLVEICDHVTTYSETIDVGTIFAFIFDFKDYMLNSNGNVGIKKYIDEATDSEVSKAIELVDGKVIDVNSLVVIKKKAKA